MVCHTSSSREHALPLTPLQAHKNYKKNMIARSILLAATLLNICSGFYITPIRALVSSNSRRPSLMSTSSRRVRRLAATVEAEVALETEEEDKIISIAPRALAHLKELRKSKGTENLFLRIGVRSGGCSGMSYVMDLVEETAVTDDDMIEDYSEHGFKCAIDPKSVLYLFGMQLDYSDALIGGGFQFQNPNAETACGCGKSFGV